jgi:3-hydroxyisobutyrate dehydrogenase-like beta-hydroxyacid dehydrogenase
MARNLLKAGFGLVVHRYTDARKVQALSKAGAEVAHRRSGGGNARIPYHDEPQQPNP